MFIMIIIIPTSKNSIIVVMCKYDLQKQGVWNQESANKESEAMN